MNHLLRRLCAAVLAAALCCCAALPAFAAYDLPIATAKEDEAIYLINLDNERVLLERNIDDPRYIASLTKMMTALLLLESQPDFDTVITIPAELTQEFKDIQVYNGTDMKLKIGESVTLRDLFHGMVIASANDAASVIAWYLGGGSIPAFVARMNERAAELGCASTVFSCPHGLYDAGNSSTARDLALLARACYAQPLYMEACQTPEYTATATNKNKERVLKSTNFMMNPEYEYYRDYIHGLKTGFTTLAGRCFVTTARQNGDTYLLVLLGSTKEAVYPETAALLDWAFAEFSHRLLLDTDTPVAELPLKGCKEADHLAVYAAEAITAYGWNEGPVRIVPTLPDVIKAPVKAGQVIGTADVYLEGEHIATVNLLADSAYANALLVALRNTLLLTPLLLAVLVGMMTLSLVAAAKRRKAAHAAE